MAEIGWSIQPGRERLSLDHARRRVREERIMERIHERDHTLWKAVPEGITDRLGWLDCPRVAHEILPEIRKVVDDLRSEGITRALVLGMGGSSLAPEVFARTFAPADDYLALSILDTTHPDAIRTMADLHRVRETVYIVSSKSGGTVETMAMFKYFYNRARRVLGAEKAGSRFIAITDPGSSLAREAQRLHFRHLFLGDPTVGGRFSALSTFGLFPALATGIDGRRLLQGAAETMAAERRFADGPAAVIGAFMGKLSLHGVDKATFVLSPELENFGDWVEQLIAESLGKEGRGIVPVMGEQMAASPAAYGADRYFVRLRLTGDDPEGPTLEKLKGAGFPVIDVEIADLYDLGRLFVLWEIAVAVAASSLKVNPFDQPDVEAAKIQARQLVEQWQEGAVTPWGPPDYENDQIAVWGYT
ncbi:MAG: hypothetical protein N2Z74_02305, partial [Syntrophales bacterium]|nr:hypothetical protein [Syntrophales bacterium]